MLIVPQRALACQLILLKKLEVFNHFFNMGFWIDLLVDFCYLSFWVDEERAAHSARKRLPAGHLMVSPNAILINYLLILVGQNGKV